MVHNHYIPQYYLQGFSTPSDTALIWSYEKGNQYGRCLPIKSVAQERGYYSPPTETFLANEIESPANAVLKKLREQQQMINPEEKAILSKYMSVMLTRVPSRRKKVLTVIPGVLQSVLTEFEERLKTLEAEDQISADIVEKRRAEVERIRVEYKKALPKDLFQDITQPTERKRITRALFEMTWIFYLRDNGSLLLTSDNPVYYHPSLGIGNIDSEVSFPISKDMLLWATRRSDLREGFAKVNNQLIKEFNRRTISSSTRFVFSSTQEKWISYVLDKTKHRLNRII